MMEPIQASGTEKRRYKQIKYGEAEEETNEELVFEGKDTRKFGLFISRVKDHSQRDDKKFLAQKGIKKLMERNYAFNKIQDNKRYKIGLSWSLKQQATQAISGLKNAFSRFNFMREERY
ncbi:hypothetical protein JTB14_018691 [Gonioctena quinquepunctata]|nr:hypothetical protein JTB14_018691 [Gonioctena quinquepunctata]